jgi:hypothetical protein
MLPVDHGQKWFGNLPSKAVVSEYLLVKVHDLPVLEMPVRVGRISFEQLVAQKQPGPMEQLRRRRSTTPMKTGDDQLIAQLPLFSPALHASNLSI